MKKLLLTLVITLLLTGCRSTPAEYQSVHADEIRKTFAPTESIDSALDENEEEYTDSVVTPFLPFS